MRYISIILTLILTFSCKVKAQETDLKIVCNESIKNDHEYSEPIIIKTCEFKNHLFKSIGTADYKGRYSYKYELFQIDKKDTIKVKNSDFFNEKVIGLEELINDKIKSEYESNSKIPEISDCMKCIDFRLYKLNEFGISFRDKNRIEFNIDNGIGSVCFNVSSSSIVLELSELEKYLK
ncbi:hypothetical protein VOI54_07435 [Tamlana sp. 2201CG12-4]|uniref:hypothetical protein n=1 Tax=Tamlana sp. 2201CG12-4 TaxID=3112582 RepID=UPI002DBB4D7D|nr:hypothetical protein [Tamlana sp. 2201CG12-4]MEC3906846.1 hypothetical protein [Tamlana sp. 2201CG12-4]